MTADAPLDPKIEREQVQAELKKMAKKILSELSVLESAQSKELLSDFVSELFLGVAQQSQREERRKKQAEGIAAAKARGVRFGRTAKAVPDNFDTVCQAWRDGELSLQQAADACGIARGTFYGMAARREQAADQTA